MFAQSGLASSRSVALEDITVIQNGRGEARLLCRHAEIGSLEGVAVSSAQVVFPIQGDLVARQLWLRVYPIMTAWDPAHVSWTEGWDEPGGDFDRAYACEVEVDLSTGSEVVSVDVLPMVREAILGDLPRNGFLLTVPLYRGEGIPLDDVSRLNIGAGSLDLTYRIVGPGPTRGD
jgi:hypothetical protein